MTSANTLIQFLLDTKLCYSSFDKLLNEQMINITPLGVEIHQILNKLRQESKESEQTTVYAAEKLQESEQTRTKEAYTDD